MLNFLILDSIFDDEGWPRPTITIVLEGIGCRQKRGTAFKKVSPLVFTYTKVLLHTE